MKNETIIPAPLFSEKQIVLTDCVKDKIQIAIVQKGRLNTFTKQWHYDIDLGYNLIYNVSEERLAQIDNIDNFKVVKL